MSTEKEKALRRLAALETSVLTSWGQVLEWDSLRRWVLENNLLDDYRKQHYFSCMEEITKNEKPLKNPSSIFSRFWNRLFPKA